jgi:hypothetical protein
MNLAVHWIPALLFLWPGPLLAATVFKSIDEHGHVTYADAPTAGAEQVERLVLHVESTARSALDETRMAAMVAVTERMAADRREREQNRADTRQRRARSQPAEVEELQRYYLPAYLIGRRYRKHTRPQHRPDYPHGPVTLPARHTVSLSNRVGRPLKPYPAYVAPAHLQLGNYQFRR